MKQLFYITEIKSALDSIYKAGGRVLHQFGSEALVADLPEEMIALPGMTTQPPDMISSGAAMAIAAHNEMMQQSLAEAAPAFGEGMAWDAEGMSPPAHPEDQDDGEDIDDATLLDAGDEEGVQKSTGTPTSRYLIGSVAVGIVIVSRDQGAEVLTTAQQQKVISEVYKGLNWLATVEPQAQVSFVYDIRPITITTSPGPYGSSDPYENFEKGWRDAALSALGYAGGRTGYRRYAEDLRSKNQTKWAYVAFFTKYELNHFAYAVYEKVVMHYDNDGWGPANIHKVFAHESCHIFGAADEYGSCSCGGSHGHLGVPNNNCKNCAGIHQDKCLMNENTLAMCQWSRGQIGWDPALFPPAPLSPAPVVV
jgi:hypothetical protein